MKVLKNKKINSLIIIFLIAAAAFADTDKQELDPTTGFPVINPKPFVVFNEGVSCAQITRIIKQDDRSNFVWQDYLFGAYFGIQTKNMKPCNSIVRFAAYYPAIHTFNGMQQYPLQTILYAFDLFAGPVFEADMWKYVRINCAPGIHAAYQLSDQYHYVYIGIGALLGLELPLAYHWTILINGLATLDYPNCGTNSQMCPFDYSWEYQLELGVRYSRKSPNKFSYINSRRK